MKKLLALLCAAALTLGLPLPALAVEYGAELNPNEKAYGQTFHDVPANHWAFQFIEELVERGAINGYPDGNFYPNNTVTRQEFAKIMVVAAGEVVYPAATVSFADVPLNHWANPFVEAAKPYMTAYQDRNGNQTFKPEAGALREDMAVAVVKLRGYDTRLADLSMLTTMFSDVDSISVSARPYVALAVENGIISGYPGQNGGKGAFGAQRTITRCEAAAILWRAFQYGSDQKVIPGDATTVTTPAPVVTPTPTAPAAPVSTPEPEPAEPEKPYIVETLVKNVKFSDANTMMTMDDGGNLIYFDEEREQIISLNTATDAAIVLLDTDEAAVQVGDATYEDLAVKQVLWDDVGKRLLVWSELDDDGWSLPGQSGNEAVFTLDNGELTYFAQMPASFKWSGSSYDIYPARIECALSDGSFILTAREDSDYGANDYAFLFDFSAGEPIALIGGRGYAPIFQHGSDLYFCYKTSLYQYDYATGGKNEIRSGVSGDCYSNGVIYSWSASKIKAYRPADGADMEKVDLTADVAIKDLRPLPKEPGNLLVTADEQYLFYDSASNAIRVIRPSV